jgi:hypothetical protein
MNAFTYNSKSFCVSEFGKVEVTSSPAESIFFRAQKMTFFYISTVLFILCPCRTAPSPHAVHPPGCRRWSWRREGCAPAGWTTPPPSTPLGQTLPPAVVTKNVVILCEIKKLK